MHVYYNRVSPLVFFAGVLCVCPGRSPSIGFDHRSVLKFIKHLSVKHLTPVVNLPRMYGFFFEMFKLTLHVFYNVLQAASYILSFLIFLENECFTSEINNLFNKLVLN